MPVGDQLYVRQHALLSCCSSFHGGLMTIIPGGHPALVAIRRTASSIAEFLRIGQASNSLIMRLIAPVTSTGYPARVGSLVAKRCVAFMNTGHDRLVVAFDSRRVDQHQSIRDTGGSFLRASTAIMLVFSTGRGRLSETRRAAAENQLGCVAVICRLSCSRSSWRAINGEPGSSAAGRYGLNAERRDAYGSSSAGRSSCCQMLAMPSDIHRYTRRVRCSAEWPAPAYCQIEKRFSLLFERFNDQALNGVFKNVGVVACVKAMTITEHGYGDSGIETR